MLPTGLFVESPEMNDVSLHRLDQDPESWPEEIIQKLKERTPQANGKSMVVKFMKKDPENGVATGSVLVSSADKSVVIPLIIKDFYLYPLDIMIAEQKLLPLTPDYFAGVFQGSNPFMRLEEYPMYSGLHRFEDASLWQANYPPGQGRYAYASAGYEILDSISDTINPTEFKTYLQENPKVAANFYKHGQTDILKAISILKPVNMNEFRQGADNLIPRSLAMLRLEGPNKYSILSNSDDVFAPAASGYISRHDMHNMLSQISDHVKDTMNEVDQNGEKLIFIKDPPNEDPKILANPKRDRVEFADEFDHYRVTKKDGVTVEGMVIPTVIDFDMNKVPLKAFIGKTMSTIQTDIAGVRVDNSSFKLKPHDMRVGQTGTFVYMSGPHKALCTVPITVKAIQEEFGDVKAKVEDLRGLSFNIRIGNSHEQPPPVGKNQKETIFDGFKRITKVSDGYVIPHKVFWVPMEGFFEVSNNPVDFVAKTAGIKLSTNPVTVLSTGYDQYSIKGVAKYASAMGWDQTNLASWQTKFLLASLGAGTQKIASVLKEAKRAGSVDIHDLKFVPLKSEKIAAALPVARAMSKKASEIRCNLIKEASYLDNAQSVDTLLALNFVNPDNISKFVGFLPRIKATISNLCSLMMAARLGIQEIPEQATSTAMYRLIDVVNGLEQLRAAQEHGVTK